MPENVFQEEPENADGKTKERSTKEKEKLNTAIWNKVAGQN